MNGALHSLPEPRGVSRQGHDGQSRRGAAGAAPSPGAALDTQSRAVLGQTVPRHTSAPFVDFLGDIVATQPKRREIHVIADNLSTHKTHAARTFLVAHPHVHMRFTP